MRRTYHIVMSSRGEVSREVTLTQRRIIRVCVHVCVWVCVRVWVCVWVCVFVLNGDDVIDADIIGHYVIGDLFVN